jgi:aminopeptidase N
MVTAKFVPRLKAIVILTIIAGLIPVSFGIVPVHAQGQAQRARAFPQTQYIPDHDFDTRHIALDLRFDWDKEQAIGRETFIFSPLVDNFRGLDLDAANITVNTIRLLPSTQLQFSDDPAKQKLHITLDRPYQTNETVTIVIDYRTNGPQPRLLGLVGVGLRFIKPTPEEPRRPKQIWSQGESEYNHYWFPCYDHPNDFFTSEVTATVEKPLSVISNGKLVETKENQDGTQTFHWKIDQPHASYLTSIVVGEYTPITSDYLGIPITSNVYKSEAAEGKVTTARLAEMVRFFSEKTGVKYPYAKYAQTMARDFPGGMENISATTQTDLMIHDQRTELDQTSDGLQSHELAHQWFGDYVTCRSWSDIWLNESFATYFQAMWDEYKLGRDDFLYSDVKANQDAYFTAWRAGNRRPIVTKNYENPDSVFDTYAYPRGGAVLHMLRRNLGEKNWWRAINYYLNKNANQPVETSQFRIAIEESTGQAMDWFFDEWLYRMGHPVFRITQSYDDSAKALELKVEQIQKPDPDSQYPQVTFFQTPVEVEIGTAAGTRIERIQIRPASEQTFTFKADSKPLLVNFDYHGTLIKELEFDKTTEELAYQLKNDEDPLGRIWALNQLSKKVKNATTASDDKQRITADIARSLTADKFWGTRLEAASALSEVRGDAARNALLAAIKDPNARVRARAVTSLASSKDPALAPVYSELLKDQSYSVIRAAASALGQTKDEKAYDALVTLLETPSWRDTIRASALAGLDASGDKRAVNLALRYTEPGNYSGVRAAAVRLLGHLGASDPKVFPLVTEIARRAFDRNDFGTLIPAVEALVAIGDSRGLPILDQMIKESGQVPQLRDQLTTLQEQLRKSAASSSAPATPRP